MSDKLLEKYLTPRRGDDERLARAGLASDLPNADGTENVGCFGWLRGVRERALMLELRKRDRSILAISYACLERAEYDPAVGITLHVLGRAIRITGCNLNGETRQRTENASLGARHTAASHADSSEVRASASGGDSTQSSQRGTPSGVGMSSTESVTPGHPGLFHGITRHRIPWIGESDRGDQFDRDRPVVERIEW